MLRNLTRGTVLAQRAEVARGVWARGRGLLGRSSLGPGEAFVIGPCSSIHTFGMRFSIDALFLDARGRCLAVARDLRPGRVGPLIRATRTVIELASGGAGDTAAGDVLSWDG